MKRTILKIERVVYGFTTNEVIEAIVKHHCEGRDIGRPIGTPHRFTFQPDGSVEFVYEFVESKK